MALMKAMDGVNLYWDDKAVRFATQGYGNAWEKRSEYLSKCYTTRPEHVVRVRD